MARTPRPNIIFISPRPDWDRQRRRASPLYCRTRSTVLHQFSRMNQIIGIVDAYAVPSIGSVLFNRRMAPRHGQPIDEAGVTAALPQARLCISEISRLMGDQPYLAGERISLADLMVM